MHPAFQVGGKALAGQQVSGKELFGVLIGFVIWLVIVLFLGRWLWNTVLVKLVSGVKPITSIWQILGLAILINLLTGL